ncbi:MAG: hypothetical protein N2490_03060 [Ignavibacteria bacterium]|nr:hypothetical protein [Ignavibacteria bacterium]
MKKLLSIGIVYFLIVGCVFSFNNNVYIGISIEGKKILLQDHIFANDESIWKENEYGSIYEDYMNYIEKFLSSKGYSLQDTSYILFDKYYPEFKKLTNIKIGEEFYLSTSKGIYKAIVTGYCFVPNDTYINGNIFYVVLEYKDQPQLVLDEPVIISKFDKAKQLILSQEFDYNIYNILKNSLKSSILGEEVKIYDSEEEKDKYITIDTIYDESVKIFKGNFTDRNNEQFIINFSQRISFEFYINTSYITDNYGNIIYKMISLQDKDYGYFIVKGIADIDGDGFDEILADQGYYEGSGYYLYKYIEGEFIVIADGFIYGV